MDLKWLVKFGVAGVVNTCVDWSIYYVLIVIGGQDETFSKLSGALGGVTSAYILSAGWVFRENFLLQLSTHSENSRKAFIFILNRYFKTIGVYSLGMIVNVVVFKVSLLLNSLELVSLVVATSSSFMINFVLSKRFVFK